MRAAGHLLVALVILAPAACSQPSTSSSSHWLSCEDDADCDNLPLTATCGGEGYCVAGTRKVEARVVFEDEFDGDRLDPARYAAETGFSVRNGDAEYYTERSENIALKDGELVLTARAEPYEEAEFTSGSIETRGLASWSYGRFEARMLVPGGRGCGPAFWMYPEMPGSNVEVCDAEGLCTEGTWPAWGDIVVMTLRSEEPTRVLHTASFATPNETGAGLTRGQGGDTTVLENPASAGWHDYAAVWGPRRIEWFVDGELGAVFDTTYNGIYQPDGQDPFALPFHLKLSLAVGGLSETPIAEDYPQELRVAWLRVTQYE
jgi:beta-glucanase (GH16 family)